ncbi:fumarylacetoacetate hydrolase family protein [Stylonychia lemnae]|uniref:Fumarylacetoacetate hydrolase family protein n=1 Tax=Stylonychia lemnae TaxID=5949 RepID=A0A078A6Z3_STYLE|nr:fumarylacetoacetate hydrolase family protein [Stylonychia lemnae]|eukprot:CDW77327.1 fumarylacetoacetate hydrolase family protein [Stylonychia lemnae]
MAQKSSSLLFNEVLSNKIIQRKCLGIAKNYFTNAMKTNPQQVQFPQYPYIFSKTLSSLLPKGQSFRIPKLCNNGQVFHEIELGVMLKRGGRHHAKMSDWKEDIGGYFLLIDYTDFDEAKKAMINGLPYFKGKAQDGFLYLSDLIPVEAIDDPHQVELELKINDQVKQKDITGNMHFKIHEQLEYITRYMTLEAGDILMTGTPEGLGPVSEGDKLDATLTYKGKVLASISDVIQKER